MSTNKETALMDAVAAGLLATGEWRKPISFNGLMKLKTVKGDVDLRVDMTPTQSNVFALEYGLAENEWVFNDTQEIIGAVTRMLNEVREAKAKAA